MANAHLMFGMLVISLMMLAGCCGPTGTPSSCTLGTYGEACTNFCEKTVGTEYSTGENCFSDCMDLVRQQDMGDATTCCRESIGVQCQDTCTELSSDIVAQYGELVEPGEAEEMVQQCYGECTGPYELVGISIDSCSLMSTDTIMQMLADVD